MRSRMKNPALVLPEAMTGIKHLLKTIDRSGLPQHVRELVGLRASQINGCSACVHGHVQQAKKAGETDERLAAVAAWRDAPFFTAAERAALALAERATRLADRSADSVPDEIWDEAAEHYDEQQLAAIILVIAMTNFFNRINTTIREPAGVMWS
ncbi:carboxymuconolactone decarboxylase family protein [Saccharopolyspora sp. 5N708]|uniref:carboxymuconolactone decarboxylase family protein n=1 Tax=Saccharopolyspora sp. 5N708 TaxID=3457424 RepID=UPI003FCF45EB